MRIAFIGQKGLPAKDGGIDKYVQEIASRLVKNGHEVFAYVRKSRSGKNIVEYEGIKLIYMPNIEIKYLDRILHKFFSTVHALFCNYDIIHYHGTSSIYLSFVSKILEWHTPVVGTIHSKDYYHQKKGIFGDDDLETCGNGFLSNLGLRGKKYILYYGKLEKKSGVNFLIEAFKQLEDTAKTPNNFKLVIVGKDLYENEYEKNLKTLLLKRNNIIFVKNENDSKIEQLFCHAYMFIQPSIAEALKLPLLRAMGHGVAPLVSSTRQHKKIVGKEGFIFESGSVQNLKEKLAYLLNRNKEVEIAGRKSKDKIESEYGWDAIVEKTIKVYNQTILEKYNGKVARNAK